MQLSAFADPASGAWDLDLDGHRLTSAGDGLTAIAFAPLDPDPLASARLLAVWLEDGTTASLTALRPTGARGQDADAVTVTFSALAEGEQIFDPRLSTEYDGSGAPRRFGIELWLGADAEGDQRPVRIGGEALPDVGAHVEGSVLVQPMRARRGERSGIALYVLIRP